MIPNWRSNCFKIILINIFVDHKILKNKMIMKKLAFLIGLLVIVCFGFSQNSKVVSAYNYHNNGKLDKAKEKIGLWLLTAFSISPRISEETFP